ncbi:hypothetical protein [Nostoc sp.]|uniref:hypothetical protein n=1 Tax=Nostoc sp. TaxID=1180 RepID=UPI002FFD29F5
MNYQVICSIKRSPLRANLLLLLRLVLPTKKIYEYHRRKLCELPQINLQTYEPI